MVALLEPDKKQSGPSRGVLSELKRLAEADDVDFFANGEESGWDAVLTGIGYGGMLVLMPNLFGAYFGRTHYSRIVGWIAPIMTVACAMSPVIAGFFYDSTGNYFFSFALAAGLIFISALISLLVRPPQLAKAVKDDLASMDRKS